MASTLAEGRAVFDLDGEVRGTVHHVTTPAAVMELTGGDLSDVIALVRAGTSAFASPLLANDVHGLLTMEGAPTSHLGILSREYDVPCVMSIEPVADLVAADPGTDEFFAEWGDYLDGRTVSMTTETDGATVTGTVRDVGGAD